MKHLFILLAAVAVISSCSKPYKQTPEGMKYKVFSENGKPVVQGDFIQMNIEAKYKDSVLMSTAEMGMPEFFKYDTAQFPPDFKEVFRGLKVGDSIILKVSTDSLIKKNQSAPFMKKGEFITQMFKVVKTYSTQAQVDSARKALMPIAEAKQKAKEQEQLKKDDKILADYLAKNNIKAQKTPNGTYVQIIKQGSGPMIDTSVVVKTNYTGKTLDGKMFDSNTDPSKGHAEPLNFNLTSDYTLGQGSIPGFTEGLKMLNKGAVAKIYIPSAQGYGARGNGPEIPANANLIFDIEVLDVLNKVQAKAEMDAMQAKMKAMQKHYEDSLKATQPKAPKK